MHRRFGRSMRAGLTSLTSLALIATASTGAVVVGGLAPVAHAATASATAAGVVGLYGNQDATYDGVYRQSLAIVGLVATGHTPDSRAITWLLAQQCADGAFAAYRPDPSIACSANTEDENATAAAVQALAALGKPTASAVTALKKFQLADGGFYDNTAFGAPASDANSTGLALNAFVAAGMDPSTVASTAGKHADDYLRSLQLACNAAAGAGAYDFQAEPTLHANDLATVQALLGELAKTWIVPTTTPAAAVPTCPASTTDAADSAAAATAYVAARLTATHGAIPSAFGSGTDWTATANAVLDLTAANAGADAVTAALAALKANAAAYAKPSGTYVAGALSTLLLVAHASGSDAGSFGGLDLASALAGTERLTAPSPTAAPSTTPTRPTTPTVAPGTLPRTGSSDAAPLAILALAMLLVGASALVAGRRHTDSERTC